MTSKRITTGAAIILALVVVALVAIGFQAMRSDDGPPAVPSAAASIQTAESDDEAVIVPASAYHWYNAYPNNTFVCWARGQEARWVIQGPGWQAQCKKWVYTGRNLTIPSV